MKKKKPTAISDAWLRSLGLPAIRQVAGGFSESQTELLLRAQEGDLEFWTIRFCRQMINGDWSDEWYAILNVHEGPRFIGGLSLGVFSSRQAIQALLATLRPR